MPSNQSPLGARPARFRRPRLLIVGCGDVGQRVARMARPGMRVLALTSSPARVPALRAQGIKLRDCTSFGLPGAVRLGVLPPASQDALRVSFQNLGL